MSSRPPFEPRYVRRPLQGTGATPARYQVGVDGGGTQTRLKLWDAAGTLIGQGEAGPSALGQGIDAAWTHIGQALRLAAGQAGLAGLGWQQCAVGLGLSGVGAAQQAHAFLAAAPACAVLALDSDGFAGVLGAHDGHAGAVLVAGTGSVGEVLAATGERRTVGGWGWVHGDEGSGAWLGRGALRYAHHAHDGRAAPGPLARAVWAVAGGEGLDHATLLGWSLSAQQQRLATLAPLVFAHEGDDPVAADLLAGAVRELEALALALDPTGALPLVLSGSVAQRLAPRFSAPLRARVVAPHGDAMDGARRLAQRALELP